MGGNVKVGPAELKALRSIVGAVVGISYIDDGYDGYHEVAVHDAPQVSGVTFRRLLKKGLLKKTEHWREYGITNLGRDAVEASDG